MSRNNGEWASFDALPPPPAASLLAAVEGMKPVRLRVPARSAVALGLAMVALPVGFVVAFGARKDLHALPLWWVATSIVAWAAGSIIALIPATLPPRGEVLPDTGKARRTAAAVAGALLLLGLFGAVDAPGHTVMPAPTLRGFAIAWARCTVFSLIAVLPVLLVGAFALRRVFPVGSAWAAAAVGAAAGAAAGLTLNILCPIGGGLHTGLAHAAGAMLGGALLGAVTLARALRT